MKQFLGVIAIILFLSSYESAKAQQVYRANNLKIFHGTKELKNPFTGGFNASMVNRVDLNSDGFQDLVVYNNYSSKINTFINTKAQGFNTYKYEPSYESFFPKEIEMPFVMRDLNFDSIQDIVMHNIDATYSVYFGKKNASKILSYQLKTPKLEYFSLEFSNFNNMRRYPFFFPVIEDFDGDGDLDIVNNNSNNNYLYQKNMSKELNLPKDSLYFVNENIFFGQFSFSANPLAFVSNFYPRIVHGLGTYKTPLTPRHNEFQSLWAMDANNDSLIDILGTNEFDQNSPLGINKGTKDSAFIYNYDTFFPSYNTPIKKWQPHGIWSDFDNDGKKDILITSLMNRDINSEKNLKVYNPDVHIFQMYKNNGMKIIDTQPHHNDSFSRTIDTFLTNEHVDVGSYSAPIYFDYNNDSLLDILIPNGLIRDSQDYASIYLYQNIGTKYIPKFSLVTNDYLNYKIKNRLNIKMAKGDLNGDKLDDLLITSYNINSGLKYYGASTSEYINYEILYQTKASNGLATFPTTDTFSYNNTNKYGIANPCLYDINQDGKLDLLVGEVYTMRYHKNLGTTTVPDFKTCTNDTLILYDDVYTYGRALNFYPSVASDTLNGSPYLYIGYQASDGDQGQIGKVCKASFDKTTIDTKRCTVLNKNVINSWLGSNTTVSIADINSDHLPDFLIGNQAGGIQIYSYGDIDSSKEIIIPIDPNDTIKDTTHHMAIAKINNEEISVFPNPVRDELHIETHSNSNHIIANMYALDGRIVLTDEMKKGGTVHLNHLESGIYILQLIIENQSIQTFKILKE